MRPSYAPKIAPDKIDIHIFNYWIPIVANRMSMDYIQMMLITVLSPIIASLIAALTKILIDHIPIVAEKITNKFEKKSNSITIKMTKTFNPKWSHWAVDPNQHNNDIVIDAIIDHIRNRGLHSDRMRCKLGASNACNNNMSDRRIDLLPMADIVDGDFVYTYSETLSDTEQVKRHILFMIVKSKLPTQAIGEHIKKLYVDYSTKVYDRVIDSQFLYKLANDNLIFKKYPVNNKMCFDMMSFPEKAKIKMMLEKLNNGEINKFTLLLHSAPGMGKTSIIKSIANMMGYCIIEIKLSLIKSDIDLINIFHEPHLGHHEANNCELPKRLDNVPLNKRIYILEDIDAETNVIHKRTDEPDTKKSKDDSTSVLKDIVDVIADKKGPNDEQAKEKKDDVKTPLTLSGVLNALDGILELNGAILVMTTNFPEKLDPALIRPGRISMNIELKKMLQVDAFAHIRRYFPGADISADVLPDYSITPAELESFCQISSNIEELLAYVKETV
jgi:hypothetical protein